MRNYDEEVREAKPMITLAFYCLIVLIFIGFAHYYFVRLQPQETAIIYVTLMASTLATCIAIATLVYSSYSSSLERREQKKTRLQQADEAAKAAANTLYITLETKLVEFIPQAIDQFKTIRKITRNETVQGIVELRVIYQEMITLSQALDGDYMRHIEKFTLLYPEATHAVFYLLSHLSRTKATHSIAAHETNFFVEQLREAHTHYDRLDDEHLEKPTLKAIFDISIPAIHLRVERDFANLVKLAVAMSSSLEVFRLTEPVSIKRSDVLDAAMAKPDTSKGRNDPQFLGEGLRFLDEEAGEFIELAEARILELETKLPTERYQTPNR